MNKITEIVDNKLTKEDLIFWINNGMGNYLSLDINYILNKFGKFEEKKENNENNENEEQSKPINNNLLFIDYYIEVKSKNINL
jgi:hypothetical protein